MKYLQENKTAKFKVLARDNGNRIDLLIKLSLSLSVYYFLVTGYLMIANSWQMFLIGSERFYILTTIILSVLGWLWTNRYIPYQTKSQVYIH